MAEIHKITKNGQTILPATTTDAVVHPELQTPLTSLINEYNVSVLFPTSGIDGTNKYDLQTAINLLDEKLAPEQKTVGIKVAFYTNDLNILGTTYTYIGDTFTDINNWGGNIQELEDSINRLERTPNNITTAEISVVRGTTHLGIFLKKGTLYKVYEDSDIDIYHNLYIIGDNSKVLAPIKKGTVAYFFAHRWGSRYIYYIYL